jgi:hypothetical protein
VTYAFRPSRVPWRRRAVLTIVPDRTCRLPPMVVVGRADGVLPLSAARGTSITTLDSRAATAGEKIAIGVRTPGRNVTGLACFVAHDAPSDPGHAQVTLVRSARTR